MARDPAMGPVTVGYSEGVPHLTNVDEVASVPQVKIFMPDSGMQSNVKVVILAGGRGTRIQTGGQEEIAKAMIDVGGIPLFEHVMRIYSAQGFRQFYVLAGYLGDQIADYVSENQARLDKLADVLEVLNTGKDTQTGGRLRYVSGQVKDDPYFLMTYCDGVSDVNIAALIELHERTAERQSLATVTLTAAHPPSRFGSFRIKDDLALEFGEKIQGSEGWMNAGFYVVDPGILRIIPGPDCRFEYDVLPVLSSQQRLAAYCHPGHFQPVDTWRDLGAVREQWAGGNAPWARWSQP